MANVGRSDTYLVVDQLLSPAVSFVDNVDNIPVSALNVLVVADTDEVAPTPADVLFWTVADRTVAFVNMVGCTVLFVLFSVLSVCFVTV